MARPPTRTALVIESSLTVWSSRIGGNIPRKSKDFAKSKGGVGRSDPSSEYSAISRPTECNYAYKVVLRSVGKTEGYASRSRSAGEKTGFEQRDASPKMGDST